MSNERTYKDYLLDIANAFDKIEQLIQGVEFDKFLADDKTAFTVVHDLKIINSWWADTRHNEGIEKCPIAGLIMYYFELQGEIGYGFISTV
jgi:hypothetical protein